MTTTQALKSLTKGQIAEARGWLIDCGERAPKANAAMLTMVARSYEGGLAAFATATEGL